ncbi:hypothetical protein BKA08_001386 [Nocardioides marinisabuli]|jgi:hypothetical protein|uniref:Uncharacterized protein n=1 Tax=Nocardioides marinisabuli TaxID=419476 RepID=A0A7Y9F020_9ACTN|nr:hypothetical protein [Nocardioides marinisabuli]NYD57148.1 hypothetical protein [Nocardioides marinisabuli]
MKIVRKAGVVVASAAVTVSLLGLMSPAEARDSSWGCGGYCRQAP